MHLNFSWNIPTRSCSCSLSFLFGLPKCSWCYALISKALLIYAFMPLMLAPWLALGVLKALLIFRPWLQHTSDATLFSFSWSSPGSSWCYPLNFLLELPTLPWCHALSLLEHSSKLLMLLHDALGTTLSTSPWAFQHALDARHLAPTCSWFHAPNCLLTHTCPWC